MQLVATELTTSSVQWVVLISLEEVWALVHKATETWALACKVLVLLDMAVCKVEQQQVWEECNLSNSNNTTPECLDLMVKTPIKIQCNSTRTLIKPHTNSLPTEVPTLV
jgi:hypothetical protein